MVWKVMSDGRRCAREVETSWCKFRQVENLPFELPFKNCEKLEEGIQFELKIPRMPVGIFAQIVTTLWQLPNNEMMLMVAYNLESKQYRVICPKQSVSTVSVAYDFAGILQENDRVIMQIHSHPGMNLKHSGIDDADEKDSIIYGTLTNFGMNLRFKTQDSSEELQIGDVFDLPEAVDISLVKEEVASAVSTPYEYGYGYTEDLGDWGLGGEIKKGRGKKKHKWWKGDNVI